MDFRRLGASAFTLAFLAGCGGGSSSTPAPSSATLAQTPNTPAQPAPAPTPAPAASTLISGKVTFDRVPHTQASGLDYANTFAAPIRGAVIEAIDASGDIISRSISDAQGTYALSVDSNMDVRLLVKAQLFSDAQVSGAQVSNIQAKWDFSVTDNTQNNQLYALQGALASSGANSRQTRNLHAGHSWTGQSYTEARSAAPFAILDSVYDAVETFVAIDPTIIFPPLELRWSVNNKTQLGDRAEGRIGTSSYVPDEDSGAIYLLGEEGRDTDEYDQHVILHEWGHYFEHQLSRTDSFGGFHALNDRLDARVAFSEGWGNALSAMITGDPIYRDSAGENQASGFSFNIETGAAANPGWFNEASVGSIIYDIFEGSPEGLAPLYNVMSSENYKDATVFTTIFALADGLRRESPEQADAINTILVNQSISGNGPNGNGESNSGAIRSALPVYKEASLNGGPVQICSVDDAGLFNKLGNREFVFLNLDVERAVQISLVKSSGDDARDPDVNIWRGSELIHKANSPFPGEEIFDVDLPAGGYVIEVFDFLNTNGSGSRRGDSCYNFTVTG